MAEARTPRGFLGEMARASAARAATLDAAALARAVARLPPRELPLAQEDFVLLGELKPSSPSRGELATGAALDPAGRARCLAEAGVSALSVLTEPSRFGGSLALLREVRAATELPIMRKDFLVSPAQVHEARLAGADLVLLVVAILDDLQLAAMLQACAASGLLPLLEAFDVAELRRADAALGRRPGLLGLNCRDLRTLAVDPRRFADLAPRLPPGRRVVAESGLTNGGGIRHVRALGYGGALVGTALMTAEDPGALARTMVQAARGPARRVA